ncbi:TPR-like protein [Hanseniaspora valbyensis NRRL Y-1626]|uniref:TPR-like protein n=1 Tax=Hanseniaspora valbyensis NRRL Y-1626 TaxID=766949 RepID=A0A1B7TK66_9ASCO|nr:TPR-like protein [Hanseniaspora valbyensis NRRL Y-1626]
MLSYIIAEGIEKLPSLFKQLETQIINNISVQNYTNVEILSQLLFSKYSKRQNKSEYFDEIVERAKAIYSLSLYHIGKYDSLYDLFCDRSWCPKSKDYYEYIWYYTYLGNLQLKNKSNKIFAERQKALHSNFYTPNNFEDLENDEIIKRIQLFGTPDRSMLCQKKAYLFLDTESNYEEAIRFLKQSVKLNPLNMESVIKINELNVYDLDNKSNLENKNFALQELSLNVSIDDIGNLLYCIYKAIDSFTQNDFFKCIRILKTNLADFLDTKNEFESKTHTNTFLYFIIYKCFIELFDYDEAYEVLSKKLFEVDYSKKLYYNIEPKSNNVNILKELYIIASVNLWQSFKITSDFKYVNSLYIFVQTMIENRQTSSLPCMIAMAILYSCMNENEQALKILNKAIQKHPEYYYTYNLLANEYINIEEYDIAFKLFSKSLDLNKYFYKTYYSLGLLYLNNGDYEKALPHLIKSLHLNKINIILLNTVGINLEKLQKTEEAKKYYKLVLTLYKEGKQNVFIQNYINLSHFKLANLAYHEKNYIEALNLLLEYTKPNFKGYQYSSSTFCNIYYLLSQIYMKLDDMPNSLNFKHKAISLDPSVYNE